MAGVDEYMRIKQGLPPPNEQKVGPDRAAAPPELPTAVAHEERACLDMYRVYEAGSRICVRPESIGNPDELKLRSVTTWRFDLDILSLDGRVHQAINGLDRITRAESGQAVIYSVPGVWLTTVDERMRALAKELSGECMREKPFEGNF